MFLQSLVTQKWIANNLLMAKPQLHKPKRNSYHKKMNNRNRKKKKKTKSRVTIKQMSKQIISSKLRRRVSRTQIVVVIMIQSRMNRTSIVNNLEKKIKKMINRKKSKIKTKMEKMMKTKLKKSKQKRRWKNW